MTMRIGLLGGSFNPIHNGHLAMGETARERLGLDLVLFIPAANPPHKKRGLLSYEVRSRLVAESIANRPGLTLSDLDRPTGAPSYTIELIARFREAYPCAEPVFLIGEDSLAALPTWKRWRELVETVEFAAFTRIGRSIPDPELAGRVRLIPMKPVRVSSTSIRRRLRQGLSVEGLVPPPVASFLTANPEAFR
jgi:nicotinate-nucleotide adenylyltransferase